MIPRVLSENSYRPKNNWTLLFYLFFGSSKIEFVVKMVNVVGLSFDARFAKYF